MTTIGGSGPVGLDLADYGRRAAQLKASGRKVVGYLCSLTPVEIITAAGLVPFRIKGDVREPITSADAEMETIVCSLVRSAFDVTLKGRYQFLDGIVLPHACDSICRTWDIWRSSVPAGHAHFINIPHHTRGAALQFFRAELDLFRRGMEDLAGRSITSQDLARAVRRHNEYRARVRALFELRASRPPRVSGEEVHRALVAGMGLPVDESAALVGQVVDTVKSRPLRRDGHRPRVMIMGAELNDAALVGLVEECGADVVADFLCPGAREHWYDVEESGDPLDAIAFRYLHRVNCSRTYRESSGQANGLEHRFGDIGRIVRDAGVDGLILYVYRYCDPFGFDVPAIKSYVEGLGAPVLHLEDDYSMMATGRLRTRVQAFVEMVGK